MGNAKKRGRCGAGAERAKKTASAIQKTRRGGVVERPWRAYRWR